MAKSLLLLATWTDELIWLFVIQKVKVKDIL